MLLTMDPCVSISQMNFSATFKFSPSSLLVSWLQPTLDLPSHLLLIYQYIYIQSYVHIFSSLTVKTFLPYSLKSCIKFNSELLNKNSIPKQENTKKNIFFQTPLLPKRFLGHIYHQCNFYHLFDGDYVWIILYEHKQTSATCTLRIQNISLIEIRLITEHLGPISNT